MVQQRLVMVDRMTVEAPHAPRRRRSTIVATSGVLIVSALIVGLARWGPDWPAQEFRAWSAAHDGLTAWTNRWYSGLALPGYSVIYPVLSEFVGASVTGVAAVILAYLGALRFAPSPRTPRLGYQLSVGFVLCADLLIGQLPYLVGVGLGIWSVRAIVARRSALGAGAAACCSLASPLAGAFLLIASPAIARSIGIRRSVPMIAAVAGIVVALVTGGGGPFPFTTRNLIWIAIFVVAAFVFTRHRDRSVRTLAAAYAIATVAALLVANPIGGNMARFGQLVALPLVWMLAPQLNWNNALRAALATTAALWVAWPAVNSAAHGAPDPSRHQVYYSGLLRQLRSQDPRNGRLEVVFTREHWEALFVAEAYPIARGWERQTDLAVNQVLYHPLTAEQYRAWLDANGVGLVALPNAPIDYGGAAEAQLLRRPPPYLVPLWHDRNWRLWRVRNARPLVSGAATLQHMGAASVNLSFHRAGTAEVRVRASSLWNVTAGRACVRDVQDGWLDVTASQAGLVTLRSQLSALTQHTNSTCG